MLITDFMNDLGILIGEVCIKQKNLESTVIFQDVAPTKPGKEA